MWVVKFRTDYDEEPVKIYAEDVDLMNMPLVYVTGIRTKHRSTVIQLPKDEAFEELVQCDPLIVCYSSIIYLGKLKEDSTVVPLGILNGEKADVRS